MIDYKDRTPGKKTVPARSQPSLLDRLCPQDQMPVNSHRQQLMQLTESVRRDLEMLLNTRLLRHGMPTSLHHVRHSIVNYGVVDIASRPLHSEQQREDFARELAIAIARFEPRLHNVNINTVTDQKQHKRFRIDAALAVGSALEPVCFESELKHRAASICISQVFL